MAGERLRERTEGGGGAGVGLWEAVRLRLTHLDVVLLRGHDDLVRHTGHLVVMVEAAVMWGGVRGRRGRRGAVDAVGVGDCGHGVVFTSSRGSSDR